MEPGVHTYVYATAHTSKSRALSRVLTTCTVCHRLTLHLDGHAPAWEGHDNVQSKGHQEEADHVYIALVRTAPKKADLQLVIHNVQQL